MGLLFIDGNQAVAMGALYAGCRFFAAYPITPANTLFSAMLGGMRATQKNDYDITVMRGPSISELILSPEPILYTGVEQPDVILALAREGVTRKRELFSKMSPDGRILREKGLEIPDTPPHIIEIDFKRHGFKRTEWALAVLSLLARTKDPITLEMLEEALRSSPKDQALATSLDLLERTAVIPTTVKNRTSVS
jgi:2-oxoglutarate/2-oxoacid ferredoxin oxidoreductase subunit beta